MRDELFKILEAKELNSDQKLQDIMALIRGAVPERKDITWLNKDLVNTDLKWAKKALPVARDMGFNAAIDAFEEAFNEK